MWWYTTRVYRASLPLTLIHEFKIESNIGGKEYGIPLSLEYDILISLVHSDPGNLDIDIEGGYLAENIKHILEQLSPIAKFVVKSQWLFLTDLGVNPAKISDYYVLEEKQLSHIISPLETKLWSNISPRPVVNFVVYFSHCTTPLYVLDKERKKVDSNAFLSPRWGGIFVLNPDKESCDLRNFKPNVHSIVSVFNTQIKHLFKVGDFTHPGAVKKLKIEKAKELLLSTHKTLTSLAQLLSEISSIVISDDVGEKITEAVEKAKLAEMDLRLGQIDYGLEKAKIAFEKSEAAFSDPSLLALLYFPEDQK